jgi:hypothetical protein
MGEDFPDAGFEVEDPRRAIEFLEHRVENRAMSSRHHAPSRNGPDYRAGLDESSDVPLNIWMR